MQGRPCQQQQQQPQQQQQQRWPTSNNKRALSLAGTCPKMAKTRLARAWRTTTTWQMRLVLAATSALLAGCTLYHAHSETSYANRRPTMLGSALSPSPPPSRSSFALSKSLPYDHYFLARTSMWAMGANARTIPPRRTNVPLVTWTKEAAIRVERAWRSVQDSSSCDRLLYAHTSYWGITSQMRDYGDAALISLAFRRPLFYITSHHHASKQQRPRRPKWCREDAWLGCFFKGATFDDRSKQQQRCSHYKGDVRHMGGGDIEATATFRPNTSTPEQRRETHARLSSSQPVVLDYFAELNFVLDDPLFFPTWLWEDLLIRDKLVRIVDSSNAELDPIWLKAHNPSLYHTLAVSALRTMLTPVLFRPHQHILEQVELKRQRIVSEMEQRQHVAGRPHPCIALHLRWTDKASDGGVVTSTSKSGYGVVDHVGPALDRAVGWRRRRRHDRSLSASPTLTSSHQCLLVLTDDDVNVIPALEETLRRKNKWPSLQIEVLSRVSSMFKGPLDDYKLYTQLGHQYVSDVMAKNAPDKAFGYFRGLVVDILVASSLSDSLIGMGSSGVSQLVSQYMGAAHRVDANALAIWQEDVVVVVR